VRAAGVSAADAGSLAQRWGLNLGETAHATYSQVWFGTRGTDHVVLKVGSARARVRESAALRIYGAGEAPMCRLLESADDAIVVERIIPGDDVRPLAAVDDDAATAVIGALIRQLHDSVGDSTQPSELPRLTDIAQAFDDVPAHGQAPVAPTLLACAKALTYELAAPSESDTLLHGDLHHQNVLRSGWDPHDCRWVAIDPHGWWGDRTFDCVAMLLDLHDATALHGLSDGQVKRRTDRRIAILADQTGLAADRITAWTIAGAVISELWCWQDHALVQHWPQRLATILLDS